MTAHDLLKHKRRASTSAVEESSDSGALPSSEEEGSSTADSAGLAAEAPTADEPKGVAQVVTPSGIEIYYQAAPKRLYRLRGEDADGPLEWVDVPSMSETLGILDKPGLPWWGMKIGVEGVLTLWDNGDLENRSASTTEEVVDLLTKHKLTVNHVRDSAGDRGTAIHDALEYFCETGKLPNVEVYAPEEQGYVSGLRQFIVDSGVEPFASEVMVGSLKYKFAGRFDLGAVLPNGARVVTKTYPKRKDVVEPIEGGRWLLDLKTSKGVYVTHFLQLEGYGGAYVEDQYGEPFDHKGVIHVTEDGRYELVKSPKTFEDFLAVRAAYDAVQK